MTSIETGGNSVETKERIRISVSNLVSHVRVMETGEAYSIAIQSHRPFQLPDGRQVPRYIAIGGGAKVSKELQDALVRAYGAEFGTEGPSEEANDARFFVPVTSDEAIAELLQKFSQEHADDYEDSVTREVIEELVNEEGIFSKEESENFTTSTSIP